MRTIIQKITVFCCFLLIQNVLFAQTPDTTKSQKSGIDLIDEIQRDIELQNRKNGKKPPPQPPPSYPTTARPTNKETLYYAPPPPPPKPKKDPLKLYHHEVQLEIGSFFNQAFTLFGLTDTGDAYKPSNYFLAYKYKMKKTDQSGAFRLGLGGNYRKIKETRGGFADNKQTIISSYGGRLGYEFQKRIAHAWVWSIGADLLAMQRTNKVISDSGFDQFSTQTAGWERGFALMSGLRWDFGERMSVGTEINLRFMNFKATEENISTANPQFNKIVRTIEEDRGSEFVGPANVYLSVRF
jgi:hypothetical protein